tara:strand:- start:267 stop:428 length:162 start_codon:yes stop_codon:yes gene_type:complete
MRQDNRTAKVYMTEKGFEVDLYQENDLVATKKVHKHSESYAEDVAENWVMRLF